MATTVMAAALVMTGFFVGSGSSALGHWMSGPVWRRLLGDSDPTTDILVLGEMDDADIDHHLSGPRFVHYCSNINELKFNCLLDDNAKVIAKDLQLLAELSKKDWTFLKVFMKQHEIYVKAEDNEDPAIHRILGKLPLILDSKVFVMAAKQQSITEFFKYAEDRDLVSQRVPCQEDSCNPMKDIWMRRNNMTRVALKTVYAIWPPHATKPKEEGGLPGGLDPEIFLHLKEMLNFDIDPIYSVDGSWGVLQSDNVTFSGMVGMFQRGEVDISMVDFSVNEDRTRVMDFSTTIYSLRLKIIVRPSINNMDFFDLFAIFSQDAVTVLAIISLINIFGQSIMFVMERDRSFHLLGNILHGTAVVSKSVINLSHSRMSKSLSGKILLLAILATGIVSFAYYKGAILSKLATSEETLPVKSLEDILEQAEKSGMTFGTVRGSLPQQVFEHAPHDTTMFKVWDQVMKPNYEEAMVVSMNEGIRKVKEENYAVLTSTMRARMEPDYPCALREVGSTVFWVRNAFGIKKNSPYKALFDYSIKRLHESGVMQRIQAKYFERFAVPDCQSFTGTALGFKSMFGVFFILFGGVGLCLWWLAAETFCGRVLRGRRRGGVPDRVPWLHSACEAAMEDVSAVATKMSLPEEEWFLRRLRSRLQDRIENDLAGRKYIDCKMKTDVVSNECTHAL